MTEITIFNYIFEVIILQGSNQELVNQCEFTVGHLFEQ